jgi:eukaryotic-like serine/threonine-protein kinase
MAKHTPEPDNPEESDWLVQYDEALARGEPPPTATFAMDEFEPHAAAMLHLLDGLRPRTGETPPKSTDALAREGVRLGVVLDDDQPLTAYQRERLLDGNGAELALGDRYLILDELGAGGMGRVLLCIHRVMRHRVAVKVLFERHARDPVRLERFRREARAAAALDHPHIVRAFEMDQAGGRPFLVMEYVGGETLHELLAKSGPLPHERSADLIRQAAAGLAHAHAAGLVHRDVKPANLMLARGDVLKVLDLGLARFALDESDQLTRETDAAALLGTADYMSPEQARRGYAADHRADIYSLGCVFFFLLTGRAPYADRPLAEKLSAHQKGPFPNIRTLRPDLPEAIAVLLARMTERDPETRIPRMAEVVRLLTPAVVSSVEENPFGHLNEQQEPSKEAPIRLKSRTDASVWGWLAGGLLGLALAITLVVVGLTT